MLAPRNRIALSKIEENMICLTDQNMHVILFLSTGIGRK
jgi:hypothetical protein